ncbi:MAG: tyrosine-type recombinase/integrase [Acidobacteria bacterium]|nr:tyrosine-type recombinase/integrase [Acidobacteriota bacterium]
MEQTTFPISQNLSLERLVGDAIGEIERLGYSRRSRNRYRATWEHLIEFSGRKGRGDQFSGELAVRFLEEYRVADEETDSSGQGWRRHMAWGVKVLADFAKSGRIDRGKTEVEAIHLVPAMQNTLRDYEEYCKDRLYLRPSTLDRRTTELTIFLDFLHSRKARSLHEIQVLDLSEFVSWRDHLQPKTVSRIVSDVGSFLRFLTMRGIVQKDLSVELPKIRVPRDATIPSVWEQELVVRLWEAVDRSAAKGKRDYAILLLACRLGMRVGDIRTLKLDQIHWEDSTIEVTQSKTGMLLSLPLTNEVGEALIDYLKSGRPPTPHREVFLKVNPPFDPFTGNNLHHIVTYWRLLAGITFRTPQKRGIHSLRHTLATRLLQKGTPFTTIAEILGHTSLESTRIYAKADVEALRSVALDPEETNHVE